MVRRVEPDDLPAIDAAVALTERVRLVDAPWALPETREWFRTALATGFDGSPEEAWLGSVEGEPVVLARLERSRWDNRDLAWTEVDVHPEHRRRGLGSEMLERVLGETAEQGCIRVATSLWDLPPGLAFARRHGFKVVSVEVNRSWSPADLTQQQLDSCAQEAWALAADYELLRWQGSTPPDLVDEIVELTAGINDAPMDDLDFEDEQFSAERLAAYEDGLHACDARLYRLVVRHRPSGELAGHTVVAVEAKHPERAHQHDTTVARTHRGHRLGLLLKTEMIRWLAEAEPRLGRIDTWNAESNRHMVAVNERLGYRILGRQPMLERRL